MVECLKLSEMSSKRGVDFLKTVADYIAKSGGHDAVTNAVRE